MIKQFTLLMLLALGLYSPLKAQQNVPDLTLSSNNTVSKTPGCVLKTAAKPNKNTVGNISNAPRPTRADEVYTLPVVFHYIHSNKTVNLSLVEAEEYIAILNRDFSLKNRRFTEAKAATKIPPYFLDVAADTKIQFCLAHTDKEGNATSGIVDKRVNGFAPVYFSAFSDKLYDDELGGSTLWPQDKYINIYLVENLDNKDAVGYADKKAKAIALEHKIIHERSTLTHEMGHYLGLHHLWGPFESIEDDLNTDCDKSDGVDDTPNQEGPSRKHPDYGEILNGFEGYFTQLFSCNNDKDGGNQFLNFMDYTAFRMFFTAGQKAKMRSFIEDNFPGLKNNGKCEVGVCANDEYDQKADNKDFDHATEITPEIMQVVNQVGTYGHYSGLICKNDVDVYKFKGVKGNKIRVYCDHSMNRWEKDYNNSYLFKMKFELFKKVGKDYQPIETYNDMQTDYRDVFLLDEVQKGDEEYYLKVAGLTANDYHAYIGYELNINMLSADYVPGENVEMNCHKWDKNQTPANATLITELTKESTAICSQKDVDYYKVYLEGDGNNKNMSNTLNVTLSELTKDLDMTIFSAAGNENLEYGLNEQSIISTPPKAGTANEEQNLHVLPGWYYIEVKSKPGVGGGLYTITIDFDISFEQGVDNALNCQKGYISAMNSVITNYEPNETFDKPTVVPPYKDDNNSTGYTLKDYICPANDTDVYEFTLDGTSDVSIHLFGNEDYNQLPADYNINLSDAKGKDYKLIQSSKNPGYDWEKIIANDLPAGKYYITVFGKDIYTHNGQVPYYLNVYVTKLDGNKINQNDLPIVSLYPNPPKNNVTINISNNLTTKNAEMTITDLYGKVMVTKIVEFVNGKLLNPFSVVNYTKGLYSVKIKDKGNVYYTKFLID